MNAHPDDSREVPPPPAAAGKSGIWVEISPGELLDKVSILEIKRRRLNDPEKLRHVERELQTLDAARRRLLSQRGEIPDVAAELKAVNETLWDIEDALRCCERDQDFGEHFIALARGVYHNNDRRAALKRRLNELFGSPLVEVKDYPPY